MTDDEFLSQFRRDPRPAFGRDLYDRLSKQGDEMTTASMNVQSAPSLNGSHPDMITMSPRAAGRRWDLRLTLAAALTACALLAVVILVVSLNTLSPIPPTGATTEVDLPQLAPITRDNAETLDELAVLGDGHIHNIAWSPRGDRLVLAGSLGLWLYDPTDLSAPTGRIDVGGDYVPTLEFSADGSRLLFGDPDGYRLIDLDTGESTALPDDLPSAGAMAFSADGSLLAIGGYDGTIVILDAATLDVRSSFNLFYSYTYLQGIGFSPDNTRLVFTGTDTPILVLEDPTGQWVEFDGEPIILNSESRSELGISGTRFTPDGTQIVARVYTDVVFFDAESGEIIATLDTTLPAAESTPEPWLQGGGGGGGGGKGGGGDLVFSPDGTLLATVDDDLRVWDIASGQSRVLLTAPQTPENIGLSVGTITFSPDWTQFAVLDPLNSLIRIHDMTTGELTGAIDRFSYRPTLSVEFSGSSLVTQDDSGAVRVWDASDLVTGAQPAVVVPADTSVVGGPRQMAAHPDGGRVARYDSGRRVELIDTTTGQVTGRLVLEGDEALLTFNYNSLLDYSPDGSLLAAVGPGEQTILLWDTATETLRGEIALDGVAGTGAFSPDGTQIALAVGPNPYAVSYAAVPYRVVVFDVTTGEASATADSIDVISTLIWSPDGAAILTASSDNRLALWNLTEAGPEVLATDEYTSAIAFSPDGTLLAGSITVAQGYRAVLQVWDMAERRVIAELPLESFVNRLTFNEEGTLIAAGLANGTVALWGVE